MVPQSDLIVVEEYPNTQPSPHLLSYQLQVAQFRSALLSHLAALWSPAPKYAAIKTVAVARLFNTFIGYNCNFPRFSKVLSTLQTGIRF